MPTTIQERDEMTATLHRTEQIAQENGFNFNSLDVLSNEYYSTVIARDQTTVESCIWSLFTETVQQLPHNERVHNAPRVSDHTWSNACYSHSVSNMTWEDSVVQSLRTNGYNLVNRCRFTGERI
ncbi:MAG: hypothetical protein CMA72_08140 [Euryarchaeota archaeon]|nr:hypothetical protein [Euryarchaeota archaeon]